MIRKQIILCVFLMIISLISFSQSAKFRLGVQYNPEFYRYSSKQINSTTFEHETNYKTSLNNAFTIVGDIGISDRIWINLGVSYVKRKFLTLEGYDHCLHNKPGEPCLLFYMMTNQQDYHIIEYPIGLSIYLTNNSKKIRPKVIGNIIGKHLISINCYFGGGGSDTEKQNQLYGIASNIGVGFDYAINDKFTFEFNCLYRFYNLRREQPILMGDNDTYFKDNNGILNLAFGVMINLN